MATEEIPGTPGIHEVSTRRPFKIGDNYDDVGEFDIKRMEKQAAQLEKDLIMKELETLDFLEALVSTKKIVESLKLELQKQAVRSIEKNPEHLLHSHIKEMNGEEEHSYHNQARMNVGKTMDNLAMIQSCVESLSTKTEEEKDFLGVASLAEELNSLRLKPAGPYQGDSLSTECEQVKRVIDTSDSDTTFHKQNKTCLRTAELRLVAARKMEEAARAVEELAIAEISQDGFFFPEPQRSSLAPEVHLNKDLSTNISRIDFTRKLKEAKEEVKQSKQALETALNRVEIANVKQLEAEQAFRQWNIESWKDQKAIRAKPLIDLPKPILKRNVSIGNVLNWKQVPTEKELVTPRRKFRFIHITVPLERQSKQKPSF